MQSFALKQGIYHFQEITEIKKDKNMARSIVKCAIRSFVLNSSINLLPKSTNFVRCISSTCTRFVGKFLNMFQLKSFYRIFLLSFFKIILSLKYLSGKVKIENNYQKSVIAHCWSFRNCDVVQSMHKYRAGQNSFILYLIT